MQRRSQGNLRAWNSMSFDRLSLALRPTVCPTGAWLPYISAVRRTLPHGGPVVRLGLVLSGVIVVALAVMAWGTEVTTGTVVAVDIHNGHCGNNGSIPCTVFLTEIEYAAAGAVHRAVDRDWARGLDVPAAVAPYQRGDRAWVCYNPETPQLGMVLSLHYVMLLLTVLAIPVVGTGAAFLGKLRS
jgi:hypothetical protein